MTWYNTTKDTTITTHTTMVFKVEFTRFGLLAATIGLNHYNYLDAANSELVPEIERPRFSILTRFRDFSGNAPK
jgi:hypothetical protein